MKSVNIMLHFLISKTENKKFKHNAAYCKKLIKMLNGEKM